MRGMQDIRDIRDIRTLLASGEVEAACAALAADYHDDPEVITQHGELARDLYDAALEREEWSDPQVAGRAFRLCIDIANTLDLVDGDTLTYLLMRAIEQTPGDEALLLEYVRQVADTNYCSTSRSLGEVAREVADPALARRLAAAHTIVEYFCVRDYLPQPIYVDSLRRVFNHATGLGVDAAQWAATRAWACGAIGQADVPEDLFARFATPAAG